MLLAIVLVEGQNPVCRLLCRLKIEPHIYIWVGIRKRDLNISVDLSLFVLIHNINYKLTNFNSIIFKKICTENNSLTVQIFSNLQSHPYFHSEERLVNLVRGRECFVGLYILLVMSGILFRELSSNGGI